jgi:hypothetical protein
VDATSNASRRFSFSCLLSLPESAPSHKENLTARRRPLVLYTVVSFNHR